jgi:hypothetical protein
MVAQTTAVDQISWTEVVSALTGGVALIVAVAVAVVEAIRARSARRERDEVIKSQKDAEKRATAKLVSAWVERTYIPSDDRTHYVQATFAHIINEADTPVFDVHATVQLAPALSPGVKPVSLGPLSIPPKISVLPPRRELIFDLTMPLHAHRSDNQGASPDVPDILLGFTDPENVRWLRDAEGELVEHSGELGRLFAVSDEDEGIARQFGRADPGNPLAVVAGFLESIADSGLSDQEALRQIRMLISPEATGWNLNAELLGVLRIELADYHVGTHVAYPAPFVAYVKIIDSDATNTMVVEGEGVILLAKMVTLKFNQEFGWQIFTYGGGGTEPDRIPFPEGLP